MAKTKINPKATQLIDKYIKDAPEFAQPILKKLRTLIHKAEPEIIEDWKWGPNFQKNGMICGIWAFKKHVSLVFFQGASLKDPQKILTEGTSNAHNRTVKFQSFDELDEKTLLAYLKEAVKNNVQGIKIKSKSPAIPKDFKDLLIKNKLLDKFEESSFSNRKECLNWIDSAKRLETRERRIQKALEKICEGVSFS